MATETVEDVSLGQLYFTTSQIIFYGSTRSITIEFTDVVDLQFGPDHIQLLIENKPTEIFKIAPEILRYEKARILITALRFGARQGPIRPVSRNSNVSTRSSGGFDAEINRLLQEVTDQSHTLEQSISLHKRLCSLVKQNIRNGKDLRLSCHFARDSILRRLENDVKSGAVEQECEELLLNKLREAEAQVFVIVTEVEIICFELRKSWPDFSSFVTKDIGSIALKLADHYWFYSQPSADNEGLDFEQSQKEDKYINLMGSTLFTMINDCEGACIRRGINEVGDSKLIAYIAARSAAERYCVDKLGPDLWEEGDECVLMSVGPKRLAMIHTFISNLNALSDVDLETHFAEMEAEYNAMIYDKVPSLRQAGMLYRSASQCAEDLWIEVVGARK